jgi:hypothetical protein
MFERRIIAFPSTVIEILEEIIEYISTFMDVDSSPLNNKL